MERQLDVLFCNKNSPELIYQDLSKKWTAIETPTWSLLLAQACRVKGFGVSILDADAEKLSYKETINRINDENPRLVCLVVYGANPNAGTTNMEGNIQLAKQLKEEYPETKIAFVGSHTSALPREVLDYKFVDFVFINEGVKPLIQLLSTDLKTDLHKVKGIGFKKDDMGILNSAENTLVDQSEMDQLLPGYAWDLIDLNKYRAHIWHSEFNDNKRTPFGAIYTSLGCKFSCDFCMINILNRTRLDDDTHAGHSNIMRYWSPEFIIKEFDKLVELGVESIRILDEMFYLNKRYYEPLLKLLIERGYGEQIRWWAYSRVNTVAEKFLELFKKAGCNYLALGIESANQIVRQEVTKGLFKDVDIREIIQKIRNTDINVISNFIVGLTGDTEQTVKESLDLAIELNTEFMNVYPCFALPGSPLYYQAKEKGYKLPQKYSEWSFLSYDSVPLPTQELTSGDVLRLRDDFWQKYINREEYYSLIKNKFGQIAENNIRELSGIKLKRKLLGD